MTRTVPAQSEPGAAGDGAPATSAAASASYTWEPTSEALAAAHGLRAADVVRFDTNTSPTSPELATRVLAAGAFEPGLSEYPPADFAPLAAAAARRYGVGQDEVLVGAGADEILDLAAKAFLRPGSVAVTSAPTYAMYRVVTGQRDGRLVEVPRETAEARYAIRVEAMREAARSAALVWLCDPNNPTGTADGTDRLAALLDALAADAAIAGRLPPAVVLDEAYAEFVGVSALPLLDRYPRLMIVRTLSKAYGLAGLRVGFGLGRRGTLEPIERYRPPASVSTVAAAVGAAVLRDDDLPAAEVARVGAERRRLAGALTAAGWWIEPSVTNFVLARFEAAAVAAAVAEALTARGLVPRTFGPGHPLEACLRLTVRSASEDDRLIAAAWEIRT